MNDSRWIIDERTKLNHLARLELSTFETKFKNSKYGWARPSAFEIKEALANPSEVYKSGKDSDSFFYIRPVGIVGTTQWFTISFVNTMQDRITTAYNATSYGQKGAKVWP